MSVHRNKVRIDSRRRQLVLSCITWGDLLLSFTQVHLEVVIEHLLNFVRHTESDAPVVHVVVDVDP